MNLMKAGMADIKVKNKLCGYKTPRLRGRPLWISTIK
jgi:hypothetical protein